MFCNLKNINDINIRISSAEIKDNTYEYRKQVRIAVIDDESFQPENNLRRNNYNIATFPDLNTIEDISGYQIVLCDLSGVGTNQNPELQGAHLISEMKKAYPEKYIIAYTGGSSDREVYAKAMLNADYFLKKDETIDQWIAVLDEAIKNVANPIYVWKKIRPKLLEADVSPYELALLEDTFVKELSKNGDINARAIQQKAAKLNLSSNAQSIISSLIANAIFKLATGGL